MNGPETFFDSGRGYMIVCTYYQSQTLNKCLRVVCRINIITFTEPFYLIGSSFNKTKKEMYSFSGWIYYDTHVHIAHACKATHRLVIIPIQPKCNLKAVDTDTLKNTRILSVFTLTGRNNSVMYYLAATMILLMLLHLTFISGSSRRTWGTSRK